MTAQRVPVALPQAEPAAAPRVSVVGLLAVLLRHRFLIIGLALAVGAYMAYRAAQEPRTFTTSATLLPQGGANAQSQGLSILSGARPQGEGTPAFYSALLRSPEVLRNVADSVYEFERDGQRVRQSLTELYGPGNAAPALKRRAVGDMLADRVATVDQSGLLVMRVTWDQPEIAQQVARRIIDELNAIDVRRRQSQAEREREFTQERLEDAASALRAAEDRLRLFLEANRDVLGAPRLQVQHQRLLRQIETLQQVYGARAQSFERASVEAVREAPYITVLSAPDLPLAPNPRRVRSQAKLGLIIGALLGVVLAVLRTLWSAWSATSPAEMTELRAQWRAATFGLFRNPFRARRSPAR